MKTNVGHFGDIFSQILGNYPPGRLAKVTGIPKQTLVSWKEGRVKRPRSETDILKVASALRCTRQEVNTLLRAAGYDELSKPKLQRLIQEAKVATSNTGKGDRQTEVDLFLALQHRFQRIEDPDIIVASPVSLYLPARPYRTLIGRDQLVQEMLAALADEQGRRLVAVDGHGGIGKTSLVYEVASQALQNRLFEQLVWLRAPKRELAVTDNVAETAFTYGTILDGVAGQLGYSDLTKLVLPQKEQEVQRLLCQQRILLVIDNLETASEPQNAIVERLLPLLTASKVLLTSRHRFFGEVYTIHLEGILENGALDFLCQTAAEKGIKRVSLVDHEELRPILHATGGSLLAMKLVVGQLGHLPLTVVLERLRTIRLLADDQRDEYSRLYKFIFLPSWHLLSLDGKKLMLTLSHFAPGVGGVYETIQTISDLPSATLAQAIDELWQLSFVETGQSPRLQQMRYYLHALTQHFVLSDIVQQLRPNKPV